MKIHVVQKGDTLWKIAEQYGVNFEELKKVNTHLTNPDLIMPGMKIKIPSHAVPVKPIDHTKEYVKEQVKPEVMPPKLEPIAVTPPPVDEEMIRRMVRDIVSRELPALVRRMLQEMKPEMVHQVKVELDLQKKTEIVKKYEKKVPIEPVKPPTQVLPYTPPKIDQLKPGIPCPPYHPSVAPYQQAAHHYHAPQAKYPHEEVSPYTVSPYADMATPMHGMGPGPDYTAPYGEQPYHHHTTAQFPMHGHQVGVAGMMPTMPYHSGYGVPQTHAPHFPTQTAPFGTSGGGKDCGCKREGEEVQVEEEQAQDD